MKFVTKSLFVIIIALISASCKTSGQQDISRVQSLLKEKANIDLTSEEIELNRYESEAVMDDLSEYYVMNIPDSSHSKILSFVKQDTLWEEIEKGYQLSIQIENTEDIGYMAYIFYVDKEKPELDVQVIKE